MKASTFLAILFVLGSAAVTPASLHIDMYHSKSVPKKQLAPKGLFKAK